MFLSFLGVLFFSFLSLLSLSLSCGLRGSLVGGYKLAVGARQLKR